MAGLRISSFLTESSYAFFLIASIFNTALNNYFRTQYHEEMVIEIFDR